MKVAKYVFCLQKGFCKPSHIFWILLVENKKSFWEVMRCRLFLEYLKTTAFWVWEERWIYIDSFNVFMSRYVLHFEYQQINVKFTLNLLFLLYLLHLEHQQRIYNCPQLQKLDCLENKEFALLLVLFYGLCKYKNWVRKTFLFWKHQILIKNPNNVFLFEQVLLH